MKTSDVLIGMGLLAFVGILADAEGSTFILDYFFGIVAVIALLNGWLSDDKKKDKKA